MMSTTVLVIAFAAWLGLLAVVWAMCAAAGHEDRERARHRALEERAPAAEGEEARTGRFARSGNKAANTSSQPVHLSNSGNRGRLNR